MLERIRAIAVDQAYARHLGIESVSDPDGREVALATVTYKLSR